VSNVNVTLVGKPGCHLCDDAREVIQLVISEFPAGSITLTEESIEDNQELFDAYWEQIPVVLINGKVHNYWRIDGERLRLKLKELQ
jgi:glutaredoxin